MSQEANNFEIVPAQKPAVRAGNPAMNLVDGARYWHHFGSEDLSPAPVFPDTNDLNGPIASYGDESTAMNQFVFKMIQKNEGEFVVVKDGQLVSVKKLIGASKIRAFTTVERTLGSQDLTEAGAQST